MTGYQGQRLSIVDIGVKHLACRLLISASGMRRGEFPCKYLFVLGYFRGFVRGGSLDLSDGATQMQNHRRLVRGGRDRDGGEIPPSRVTAQIHGAILSLEY